LKIKIEQAENEEIIIRCREPNEKIYALKTAIEEFLREEPMIRLFSGATVYLIPQKDILFFESHEGKVYAHTNDAAYTTQYKLFELEERMGASFVRISKSVIVNLKHIVSIRREMVGNGEISFRHSPKKVYFSRAYYKLLQYRIEEMRLSL
jgi:DNA-binding LytR/AlgR family response regulator